MRLFHGLSGPYASNSGTSPSGHLRARGGLIGTLVARATASGDALGCQLLNPVGRPVADRDIAENGSSGRRGV